MEYIGRTLAIKSERTGRVESIAVLIARSFPSSFDFQVFLIELYLKDFGVYQTYTMFLDMYLTANQDNLPDDEILENRQSSQQSMPCILSETENKWRWH